MARGGLGIYVFAPLCFVNAGFERMEGGAFPGADLCADLLTKAVVTASSWEAFRIAVGLTKCSRNSSSEKLQRVAAAMIALSSLVAHPGVSSVAGTAGAIGMSALSALCSLWGGDDEPDEKEDPKIIAGHKTIWANHGGSTGRGTQSKKETG